MSNIVGLNERPTQTHVKAEPKSERERPASAYEILRPHLSQTFDISPDTMFDHTAARRFLTLSRTHGAHDALRMALQSPASATPTPPAPAAPQPPAAPEIEPPARWINTGHRGEALGEVLQRRHHEAQPWLRQAFGLKDGQEDRQFVIACANTNVDALRLGRYLGVPEKNCRNVKNPSNSLRDMKKSKNQWEAFKSENSDQLDGASFVFVGHIRNIADEGSELLFANRSPAAFARDFFDFETFTPSCVTIFSCGSHTWATELDENLQAMHEQHHASLSDAGLAPTTEYRLQDVVAMRNDYCIEACPPIKFYNSKAAGREFFFYGTADRAGEKEVSRPALLTEAHEPITDHVMSVRGRW